MAESFAAALRGIPAELRALADRIEAIAPEFEEALSRLNRIAELTGEIKAAAANGGPATKRARGRPRKQPTTATGAPGPEETSPTVPMPSPVPDEKPLTREDQR
jgi:hypothetical protein